MKTFAWLIIYYILCIEILTGTISVKYDALY